MVDMSIYGVNRSIEPKNVLPQPAWKLNNFMSIYDNEILVDVKLLNIDYSSFSQIYTECDGKLEKIESKILDIVRTRGKLHNPITGTGGILYGIIKKIGADYPNYYDVSVHNRIISLASLSLIPLKINKINHIDVTTAQVEIEGQAILFGSTPLIKVDNYDDLRLLMLVLDEAGAAFQSWRLAKRHNNVLIIGAESKLGLLCSFAVKEKIGNDGQLVGIVSSEDIKKTLEKNYIFDKIQYINDIKLLEFFDNFKIKQDKLFDLVINCNDTSGSEVFSVLYTKNKGKIFYSSLNNNYKIATITAEGMGKDIDIYAYKGFIDGHADFAANLLKKNEVLKLLLSKNPKMILKNNNKYLKQFSNISAQNSLLKEIDIDNYVFVSSEMQQILNDALKVANYDCTVLITGESGVGKEVIVNLIHRMSYRRKESLIKINCGSIPGNLLESELFGYEPGAFTGANKDGKMGFFEIAHNGILFLDEVGDLPLSLQVKLLRVLQEGEIYRIGGTNPIKVDVRIIAATNKNLKEMVSSGVFREDLYYRLNVFPIKIPPLRKRKEDIIPFALHFINKYNAEFKLNRKFSDLALQYLLEYKWPGNIREMENFIQRLLINTEKDEISILDVINNIEYKGSEILNSNDIEKLSIKNVLENVEYKILKVAKSKYKTTRQTAKALGLSQSTLVRKLNKYNIN